MKRKFLLIFSLFLLLPSLFAFQSRKKAKVVEDDEALKRQMELLKLYENRDSLSEEERKALDEKIAEEILDSENEIARLKNEKIRAQEIEQEKLKALEQQQKATIERQIDRALRKDKQKVEEPVKHKEYLSEYFLPDEYEIEEVDDTEEEVINPNETDSYGRTKLINCAKKGNAALLKTLLKNNPDLDYSDSEGWTALMYAVRYSENLECVNLLLKAGADVKKQNKYGQTALSIASCYNTNKDILSVLLKKYKPSDIEVLRSFVFLLSEQNIKEDLQLSKIQIFLKTELPLNVFYEGKTPLMYAAAYGNSTKAIQLLLDEDASITLRTADGKTAFDFARTNKNLAHDKIYWSLNIN